MKMKKLLCAAAVAGLSGFTAFGAAAQETIKIGLVAPFSGPFADYGKQMEGGMKAYMKQHGDTVAGKKIEIIVKDTTGPAPEVAKRLAQELVTRDKVDFLAGFGLTPEALAVAPVAEQAKKPMIIMNAATSIITTKSPYIARVSMTLPQVSAPMATWAAKNGIKKVDTLVADYGPGIDAEARVHARPSPAAAARWSEAMRAPLQNPEFAPFIQRIKDAKPDAVFVFVPAGEQGIAFMKGYRERGLAEAGIKVIATGDLTDDDVLPAMGDAGAGRDHHLPLFGRPRFAGEQGIPEGLRRRQSGRRRARISWRRPAYDGMAAIYEVAQEAERQDRWRQGDGGAEGHEDQQPARPDHDRPGNPRHGADGIYPQGREGRRRSCITSSSTSLPI